MDFEKEGKMSKASELFMRQLENLIISEKNLEMIEKIGEGITSSICVCVCVCVCVYVCERGAHPFVHLSIYACVHV